MFKKLLGKGIKGFFLGLIPLLLVTLRAHGCNIDDLGLLGKDMAVALVSGLINFLLHYYYPETPAIASKK